MMFVEPYRRTPTPPIMGVLTPEGRVLAEDGWTVDFDDWPPTHRAWCSYDTARALILAGEGEAVCWNNEEIRWRHRRFEDGWKNRPSDVNVIKLPWDDYRPESVLRALVAWRDWLAGYGASPTGTAGSASWSLLRAVIGQPLITSRPTAYCPPLVQVLGGRQELGLDGQGVFTGRLEQVDLPAAYASELGAIPYGGQWQQESVLRGAGFGTHDPAWWANHNRPVFVRARVKIPADIPFGPLPRRPRAANDPLLRLGLGAEYPVGVTIQGFWTWQELVTAERHGCKILRVLEIWAHVSARRPFAEWWDAIEAGRAMPGLAGVLAKITGNALWGRLCMTAAGKRTIRGQGKRELESRPLPLRVPPAALDLAETISGRTRAKLVDRMLERPELVVSGHTDGLWLREAGGFGQVRAGDDAPEPLDWRRKKRASRIEILTPQVLRFWPRPASEFGPETVFAGEPALTAPAAFDKAWERFLAEQGRV